MSRFNRTQSSLFTLALGLATACASQGSNEAVHDDSSTSADDSSTTTTEDEAKMVALEKQPGYKVVPYGSCADSERIEESCGGPVLHCTVTDREHPTATICVPPCVDGACPASGDRPLRCTSFPEGCLIDCAADPDCPKGMLCANPGGTRYCAWPVLWEGEQGK